jgi:hypothetical protein
MGNDFTRPIVSENRIIQFNQPAEPCGTGNGGAIGKKSPDNSDDETDTNDSDAGV